MNGTTGILAGLYVLLGFVGFLPGVFLLLGVALGLAFWALMLRTATPPVGIDRFLEGVQVAALDAFPDFPFGLAGLGLLALHCLLSIPNFFGGLALLRNRPGARERVLRLGALNLLAFPVGTALGVLTIWALNRPDAAVVRPVAPLPSAAERVAAALCYLVPVLVPLYLLLGTRPGANVRVHAFQSIALWLACLVAANLVDALAPLAGFAPSGFVTGAAVLLFVLLAALAYGGNAPKLPGMEGLAERWQSGAGALVERAIAKEKESLDLEAHRRGIAYGGAQPAKDVLPKVAGTPGPYGFTQRGGRTFDVPLIVMIAVITLMVGLVAARLADDVGRKGAAGVDWAVAIPGMLVFGGFGAFMLFLLGRSAIANRMNGGELGCRPLAAAPWGRIARPIQGNHAPGSKGGAHRRRPALPGDGPLQGQGQQDAQHEPRRAQYPLPGRDARRRGRRLRHHRVEASRAPGRGADLRGRGRLPHLALRGRDANRGSAGQHPDLRRARPAGGGRFMIEFTRAQVPAGGSVAGRIAWRPGAPAPAGEAMAWLVWRLEVVDWTTLAMGVSGFEDYAVVDRMRLDPQVGTGTFEFRIPEQGPVSYEGKLFRVIWEIVVGTQSSSSGPQPAAHRVFRVVARPSRGRLDQDQPGVAGAE